ncbi:HNH endonuclease [Flavobacterium tructae]|uniref:HNH endonuclease n=1 Tax=Flavobacterium tructae TaxID=1114873 RepID=UPI0035A911C9
MDNILKPIVFSDSHSQIIKTTLEDKNFHHTTWGEDHLEEIRSEIRKFYRNNQKVICAYCKSPVSIIYPTNCHIEHIAPKSLHPEYIFEPKNLCVICADCNQIKRNQETINQIPDTLKKKYKKKYPNKSEDFFIVHPHFDKYEDHIQIINGYYIDKASKKGNFTIGACLLNRKFLILGWQPEIIDDNELINDFSEYIEEKDFHKRVKKLDKIKRNLFY